MLTGGAGNQTKNLKIISNGEENGKGTAVKKTSAIYGGIKAQRLEVRWHNDRQASVNSVH